MEVGFLGGAVLGLCGRLLSGRLPRLAGPAGPMSTCISHRLQRCPSQICPNNSHRLNTTHACCPSLRVNRGQVQISRKVLIHADSLHPGVQTLLLPEPPDT